ncbi:MAG TPA: carboxypeptidase regulatory-like domain-containing protein [Gemmatimonas sp.]|nr:carboxypeptidase regulatory-like domain-containing protein [Gemmatimonas sp.]
MRLRVEVVALLLATVLPAWSMTSRVGTAAATATAATVTGVVIDSIAERPLAGALVQLVAADTGSRYGGAAVADSLGRFEFADVPDGRYMLGFLHPMLDSLGIEPPLRSLVVAGPDTVRADLAIPGAARLRMAVCGPPTAANSGTMVIGIVRNAEGRTPVAGARVTGEWFEYSVGNRGVESRRPRRVATSGSNGWFALCNVPSPGTVALAASNGVDSTDLIEVEIPARGVLRRELYLGGARAGANPEVASDRAAASAGRRTGEGQLSGVVVATQGRRPVAGAQVGISNGAQTTTDAQGAWSLANIPAGTRVLDVRAVGYYPERRAVDVVAGAAPVAISLRTFEAVLAAVKVTARTNGMSFSGFADRSRMGNGRFLTQRDIERRQPVATSEIFRSLPGVYLEILSAADTMSVFMAGAATGGGDVPAPEMRLVMRGTFTERCLPNVYLNSNLMNTLTALDIDALLKPKDIAAIEVYSPTQVPPQFQTGPTGCGAILFWTR